MANSIKEKADKNIKNRIPGDIPSNSSSESSLCSISSHDEFFKSRNHADLNLMKMYKHFLLNQLTDVTLIAGETTVRAHRLVLSSASDYFSAMFTGDLVESRQEKIELHGVCGVALKDLVNYCYTGQVELREDSVETLLATASLLGLNKVVEACSGFLRQQLDPSNCIGIALFADSRNCLDLRDAAIKFIAEHFVEVLKNQEFLTLPAVEVAKLLKSDELNVPSEEDIFYGVMSWVEYDKDSRSKDIANLLQCVKLPLLSPSFLADVVEPWIKDNAETLILLMEALKYHLLPERRSDFYSWRTVPRKSTIGLLYAVGGMDANKAGATSIEVYNAREDKWSTVGSMGGRRLQFGVAALDRRLIVVGGRDGLKTLNSVEWFNLETRIWSSLAPMSTHRHGLGLALISDSGPLYAVGGHDGWSYLNTVERWDPETGQWSYVAPMTTQRSTVGLAVLNNRLYAVGGRDGVSCLRTVEVYDPHTNKWTNCSPMSKRRGGVAVAVLGECLYALGGHDVPTTNPSAARFDCVERYDPKTDTWTNVACMSVGRDAIGIGVLGDQLLAVGGYDGQSYLRLVEAYNPYYNTWTQVASLNTGRAGSCVVSIKT
ncbi:kelch-like protein 5 [Rhodnius prolixus]